MRILVMNGPNLNLLGTREPEKYGSMTLGDLEAAVRKHGQSLGVDVDCHQSNHEGDLIDALHKTPGRVEGVVFNPGGYTHTSVALRDAIAAIPVPVIEVHMTNIHDREEFRSRSLTAAACAGQISGMGVIGYEMAVSALARMVQSTGEKRAAATPEKRVVATPEKPAAAPATSTEGARLAEERESKRRRRGRRGGRGRRRDIDQPLDRGANVQDKTSPAPAPVDLTEHYAELKGISVRRGLDVVAEDGDEKPPELKSGVVNFSDEPDAPAAKEKTPPAEEEMRVEAKPVQKRTTRRRATAKPKSDAVASPDAKKSAAPAKKVEKESEPKKKPAKKTSTRRTTTTARKKKATTSKSTTSTPKKK